MYPNTNEEAAWQRIQDLQREAENNRLTAGYPPRTLVAGLWLARRVSRLARSGWHNAEVRFQRRHVEAELEGTVDRWLKRSQAAGSGECDGAQEVA